MAKLTIEIEENEFALWDFTVYENGEFLFSDGNFTSEEAGMSFIESVMHSRTQK